MTFSQPNNEQAATLTNYRHQADRLKNFRFYSQRFNWNVSFVDPESSTFPDDEDFRAFLTLFRQFLMKSATVHLPKIWELVIGLAVEPKDLIEARKTVEHLRKTMLMHHIEDEHGVEKILNTEQTFDTYINAEIFHDDKEKKDLLNSLHPAAKQMWHGVVLFFINYVLKEIAFLEVVAQDILDPLKPEEKHE